MPTLAHGAAFVDSSGGLVTAEPGFLRELGLVAEEAAATLRARAAREPGLGALLRGEGPAELPLVGASGEPLSLQRHAGPAGSLILLRAPGDAERLEHAARSQGLELLAGGLAHDVNGPLNTMTLQLALLAEKLEGVAGAGPAAAHLVALRAQIDRVHLVVHRFHEAVGPAEPLDGLDLAALAGDLVPLFTNDLHRREIRLGVEAPAGAVRTGAPAARVVRLVLGLLTQAVATTPIGGALAITVAAADGWATLTVHHSSGAPAPLLGYYSGVAAEAAAELGGRLVRSSEDGRERLTLQLPKGQRA
jgi:signal transduction histidine kinase